jgi:hypothetical protein
VSEVPHHDDAHGGGHGNTPAAWIGVVVGLVGFTIGGVGLMFNPANFAIFWVGVVVTLVGLVAYLALPKLGLGG